MLNKGVLDPNLTKKTFHNWLDSGYIFQKFIKLVALRESLKKKKLQTNSFG